MSSDDLILEMLRNDMVSRFKDRYLEECRKLNAVPDILTPDRLLLLELMADEAVDTTTTQLMIVFRELGHAHRCVGRSPGSCYTCSGTSATGMPMAVPWPCEVAKLVEKALAAPF